MHNHPERIQLNIPARSIVSVSTGQIVNKSRKNKSFFPERLRDQFATRKQTDVRNRDYR